MQEQDGNKQFNISERLEDLRREHEALRWEGSFRDYFELVAQNPRIAQLSHARINDMVHAAGIERLNEGTQHEILSYNFFAHELFGIEEPIAKIVEYFKSAAQRLEVRKRILLLMGPVGGGKSTIVNMLKRGLEDWTKAKRAQFTRSKTVRCTKNRCISYRTNCALKLRNITGFISKAISARNVVMRWIKLTVAVMKM